MQEFDAYLKLWGAVIRLGFIDDNLFGGTSVFRSICGMLGLEASYVEFKWGRENLSFTKHQVNILRVLAYGPQTTKYISEAIELDLSATIKQLTGLVNKRRVRRVRSGVWGVRPIPCSNA